MVSKAKLDLPEPDKPVITTSLLRGMLSEIFLRLCTRAPRITMLPAGATVQERLPLPAAESEDCLAFGAVFSIRALSSLAYINRLAKSAAAYRCYLPDTDS